MSRDILEIMESASTDNNSTIWLKCQPIADTVPSDAPDLKLFVDNYWAGKILFKSDNNCPKEATDWFSIPKENIIFTTSRVSLGEFYINVDKLTQDEKTDFFRDVKPTFSIKSEMSPETKKWLDDLYRE